MKKRGRREVCAVGSGRVAIGNAFQKFRLRVIAQSGLAQRPGTGELSGWDVKKTGNGKNTFSRILKTQCGSELARDEAVSVNRDVE
jgi:hypothetical protein